MKPCPRCGVVASPEGELTSSQFLLRGFLETGVMMAQQDLQRTSWSEVSRMARESSDTVAAHGDDLEFGGKHCKSAFAALARGLAALSFAPGGVRFLGAHWCAKHPETQSTDGQYVEGTPCAP